MKLNRFFTPNTHEEPTRLVWWIAVPVAAIGGLLLDVATPSINWWPAAVLAIVLISVAVWQQRGRVGFFAGTAAGIGFWFPHIFWLTLYLGPVPWLALGTLMTLWFGVFGLAAAAATRGLSRLRLRLWQRTGAQVSTVAGLWVLREELQSSVPYGGFAWGRLAHTQAEGPLAEVVSWLGFSGLSGVIALFGVTLAALVWLMLTSSALKVPPRRLRLLGVAVATAGIFGLFSLLPVAAVEQTGTLRVAAIQGNSKSGIFDDRDSGDVLRDHIAETERLISDLDEAGESVDVIVWPENSAEFDLPENRFGAIQIRRLARLADAPIVIGSVVPNSDGTYSNSSLVWGPSGQLTDAAGQPLRYDKRYPVPFAEYMPHRAFYRALAPDLVDLVQLSYAPGQRSAAMDIPTGPSEQTFTAGFAICFDIIFDPQAREMVDAGAEIIFAQTNNADFGRTDESAQQLQIAHLRALETGRALVNISTVGTSAVVLPDGEVIEKLTPFTADYMVTELPLTSGLTPALQFGGVITGVWIFIGAAGLATGLAASARASRAANRHLT